ncbi:hypothetical protein [Cognatishimia sp.]|uniref:hypothetical protein n=1 Tax=Cognatishimia sp. TaxID=2211648 RepID=UPI003515035A|nr:hypothetical protein [Cognatishimia sp.]
MEAAVTLIIYLLGIISVYFCFYSPSAQHNAYVKRCRKEFINQGLANRLEKYKKVYGLNIQEIDVSSVKFFNGFEIRVTPLSNSISIGRFSGYGRYVDMGFLGEPRCVAENFIKNCKRISGSKFLYNYEYYRRSETRIDKAHIFYKEELDQLEAMLSIAKEEFVDRNL